MRYWGKKNRKLRIAVLTALSRGVGGQHQTGTIEPSILAELELLAQQIERKR
ncbi:hypothetical protein KKE06_05600 [Candidatus Micrarchaeota archaeon]|nr:hypothetical protein [Candidatus Micrarchaeota archaeon]